MEATEALEMSLAVMLRLSRMTGIRGGAANVDMKQVKKEIQERWNVRMCGFSKRQGLKTVALCSESTGRLKCAVGSTVFLPPSALIANTGSLPVTPCMELPGSPFPSSSYPTLDVV